MRTAQVSPMLRAGTAGCLALLVAACSVSSGNQPPETEVRQAERKVSTLEAGTSIDVEIESTSFGETGRVSSWSEFIALQAASDQEYLRDLDQRYFGVMSFNSVEERNYMLRAGFPTPGEWLAATRMTDRELQDRADAGDAKAAGFLADRMSQRLESLVARNTKNPGSVGDSERVTVAATAVAYSTQAMEASRSPFALYIEGMVKSSIFDSWEPMTAAMIEGKRRGDPRVSRLVEELHAQQPLQDIGAIYAALEGMERNGR